MDQTLLLSVLLSQLCWSVSLDLQYHFIDKKMSWSEAQSHCREQHTDLASVNDMKDLKNLKAAANGRTDAWIGLHQTSDNPTDKKWHWSQPTVRYKEGEAQWTPGQPDSVTENCVVMTRDVKWNDTPCHYPHIGFICYNESSNTTVMISNKGTWSEAQQFCRTNHTDLMSGLDQHKLFQEQNLTLPSFCWIGLFRDTWSWSDRSDSSFRNWNSHTSINPETKKCAALGAEGRWESDDCGLKKSFICEGAPKRKKTLVKIKMSSPVDPNKFSSEILQQLQKQFEANNLGDVKLTWKKDENQPVFKKQKSSTEKKSSSKKRSSSKKTEL
ncbi:unnamed protein product [Knipowitschia caucasica]|uniref:C-type lectin domain-containing protein n=1 Tax=Knipowitschia caucasica TaxID=637954 RepID=A0AAV2KQ70_KNICA